MSASLTNPHRALKATHPRRAFLKLALRGASLLALGGCAGLAAANLEPAASKDARLIDCLCDLVIPDTDTPGARAAGAPAFVRLAIAHGMKGAAPDTLATLSLQLDAEAGGEFLACSTPVQAAALAILDANTVAQRPPSAWGIVKSLILRGYYTSEIGASKELRFDPVPALYDGNVDVVPGMRAWSTDANARNFS